MTGQTTKSKSAAGAADSDTLIIPVVTPEEVPRLNEEERRALIAKLEQSEADMKAGKYVTYSPEWLRHRFEEIYYDAQRTA